MAEKKNILTYEGLKALEEELQDLKLNRRKQVAIKIKEAREQGDLSENAEYDAAKEVMEYKIVGSTEADCLNGKISNESPVGVALIGSKEGEQVEVETPSGEMVKYEILSIKRTPLSE